MYWAQVVHNFMKEACYEDGDSKITKPYSDKALRELKNRLEFISAHTIFYEFGDEDETIA